MKSPADYVSARAQAVDASGIRKVFDLAAKMKHPINLSIGQPDFDVPEEVKTACIDAIKAGKNSYALTQGMPVLREKLQKLTPEARSKWLNVKPAQKTPVSVLIQDNARIWRLQPHFRHPQLREPILQAKRFCIGAVPERGLSSLTFQSAATSTLASGKLLDLMTG